MLFSKQVDVVDVFSKQVDALSIQIQTITSGIFTGYYAFPQAGRNMLLEPRKRGR